MSGTIHDPNHPGQPHPAHDAESGSENDLSQMMPQKEVPKTPFGSGSSAQKTIQFKGRPGSLELVLDPDAPLLEMLQELRQSLLANQALVQHAKALTLTFGTREIDKLQYGEILKVVESHGLSVTQIALTPEALDSFLEGEFGVPVRFQRSAPAPQHAPTVPDPQTQSPQPAAETVPAHTDTQPSPVDVVRNPIVQRSPQVPGARPAPMIHTPTTIPALDPISSMSPEEQKAITSTGKVPQEVAPSVPAPAPSVPAPAPHAPAPQAPAPAPAQAAPRKLHKVMRNCRSGTSLSFEGDVVIFGDLNAGAEVKATGDIIVLGSLLGVAHAGCKGDTEARIFANDLSPTQLRLAHQIAIAPPSTASKQRARMTLEMAYLNHEEQIEVKNVDAGRIPM